MCQLQSGTCNANQTPRGCPATGGRPGSGLSCARARRWAIPGLRALTLFLVRGAGCLTRSGLGELGCSPGGWEPPRRRSSGSCGSPSREQGRRPTVASLDALRPVRRVGTTPYAAVQEARALLDIGQPQQALGYCSLAVLASGSSPCHLRLRAACLAQLQKFDRALGDLNHVLQEDAGDSDLPRRAEDFCSQGRLLLSLGDEERAAGAFSKALELSPAQAQNSLWKRPGQAPTATVFLIHGQRCLEDHRYEEAWTAAQSGLLVDPGHSGLKRLKARTRKEVSSGCQLH